MSESLAQYQQDLRRFSDELIRIQTPIKILDAIKWPREMEERFLSSKGTALPAIKQDFYQNIALPFDPVKTQAELASLKQDIHRRLGKRDKLGKILVANVDQYRLVVDMLGHRGTPTFGKLSQELYGSANHKLHGDRHTLRQLGDKLSYIFSLPAARHMNKHHPKIITAPEAVHVLSQRLEKYFHSDDMRVRLSDGIVSDAAVGGDTVKLNSKAMFSESDLNVYEVHEGWVHVGTTLNGRAQPHATWLSVGSPRVAATQEGLAVLLEMLTLSSNPGRARRISDRVAAVDMAENGADFIDVFNYFRGLNLSAKDSYRVTQRVFRGGMVEGGSFFTKDISYVRGYVENINFIRSAITSGLPELIPMLFLGKLAIEDIPVLYQACQEGIITPPKYLPPMFDNFSGLYAWFGFASGLAGIDLKGVQRHFTRLFKDVPNVAPVFELLSNVEFIQTTEESIALNDVHKGLIIIAGSGMCNGGRIRSHFEHNLWRPECDVIICGYQAIGTPGRALVDGAEELTIHGNSIKAAAKLHTVGGLSAHADQAELLNWYRHFDNQPPLILVHGEPEAQHGLVEVLNQDPKTKPQAIAIATQGDRLDLNALPKLVWKTA